MCRQLGRFALLALCLFAIVIAMGGCATAKLLPSYPPPNPGTETWIPYELPEPAAVTITIHDSDEKLVRKLELGQKPAGTYKSRDRAAHWDGLNEQGEPVASGTYDCTLTAGEFSTTRWLYIGTGLRPSYSASRYSGYLEKEMTTQIPYHLSEPAAVTLTIHDSDGNLVRMLEHSQKPAGHYRHSWDRKNAKGEPVAWGTYVCRLTAGEFSATQELVLKRPYGEKSEVKKDLDAYIDDTKKSMDSISALEDRLAGKYTAIVKTPDSPIYKFVNGSLELSTRGNFILKWSVGSRTLSSMRGDWTAGSTYLVLKDVRYLYKILPNRGIRTFGVLAPGNSKTVDWEKQ